MTKSIIILSIAVAFLIGTLTIQTNSNISAQEDSIPSWVKINAGFWANNQISDTDFLNGIEYLIGQEIIQVSYEIPKAVAQIETPPPVTFYVVQGVNQDKITCDEGDTVISGGLNVIFGRIWAQNSYPIKTSEELSYYDGWKFYYWGEWTGGQKVETYAICADTNL